MSCWQPRDEAEVAEHRLVYFFQRLSNTKRKAASVSCFRAWRVNSRIQRNLFPVTHCASALLLIVIDTARKVCGAGSLSNDERPCVCLSHQSTAAAVAGRLASEPGASERFRKWGVQICTNLIQSCIVKVVCLKFWHKPHLWLGGTGGKSPELGGPMYPPVPIVPTPLFRAPSGQEMLIDGCRLRVPAAGGLWTFRSRNKTAYSNFRALELTECQKRVRLYM